MGSRERDKIGEQGIGDGPPSLEKAPANQIRRYRQSARQIKRECNFPGNIQLRKDRGAGNSFIEVEVSCDSALTFFTAEADINQFRQHLIKIIRRAG